MSATPATVVVTGAAGRLGRAVAEAFAADGANLVLVGSRRAPLVAAFGDVDPRRLIAPADLLDRKQADGAVEAALARFGRIDVLCNIAGGFRMGPPVHGTSDDDWNFLLDVNVRTMWNAVRAVVPGMIARRTGKILALVGGGAARARPYFTAYAASKTAVVRLVESLAEEVREHNIQVNAIAPGWIETGSSEPEELVADALARRPGRTAGQSDNRRDFPHAHTSRFPSNQGRCSVSDVGARLPTHSSRTRLARRPYSDRSGYSQLDTVSETARPKRRALREFHQAGGHE